jgi:aldehyde dehydrogenase (NAD+)
MGYIRSGKEEGAIVHIGGERHGNEGYFIQPTIFTECKPNMKIVQEEIFGPVAAVIKFTTEEGKHIPYRCIRALTKYHRGD